MEARWQSAEAQKYKTFTQAVNDYVAANPTYTGTLTWPTLQSADTTAPSLRGATMPPSYKAVVNAGTFTICGELSQGALALIVDNLPDEQRGKQTAVSSALNTPFQVLGPSSTDFTAEASKCVP